MTARVVVLGLVLSAVVLVAEQDTSAPHRSATIVGRVTAPNGSVWPGLTVWVSRLGAGGVKVITTDPAGLYHVPVIAGVYRIVMGAQTGFFPTARDEVEVGAERVVRVDGVVRLADRYEFGGGQPKGPADGDLLIRVLDAFRQPLPAAKVSILEAAEIGSRWTDVAGSLWTVLPQGRYAVRVVVAGFETKTVSPVVVRPGLESTAEIVLELAAKYRGARRSVPDLLFSPLNPRIP